MQQEYFGLKEYILNLDDKNKIDIESDRDEFREKSKQMGTMFFEAFSKKGGMSQVRNLENIAYNSNKLSDIFDYIKGQTGKCKRQDSEWRYKNFGKNLLEIVEGLNLNPAPPKAQDAAIEEKNRKMRLELIRQFIKQMARHFMFKNATK